MSGSRLTRKVTSRPKGDDSEVDLCRFLSGHHDDGIRDGTAGRPTGVRVSSTSAECSRCANATIGPQPSGDRTGVLHARTTPAATEILPTVQRANDLPLKRGGERIWRYPVSGSLAFSFALFRRSFRFAHGHLLSIANPFWIRERRLSLAWSTVPGPVSFLVTRMYCEPEKK
jgi:hypothetical protein